MEYWWKENRRFVLPVSGGAVILLLWWLIVLGGIEAAAASLRQERRTADAELRARMALGVPGEDTLVRARRDAERSDKLLADLQADLSFRLPDDYQAPAGKSPTEFFGNQKSLVRKRLQEAAKTDVVLPEDPIGLKGLEDAGDDLSRELIVRLAIAERLVLAAIQSGAVRVELVDAMVGLDPDSDRSSFRKGEFLNVCAVRARIQGPSRAVFEWLHAMQKKGSYLAVEQFSTTRENGPDDLFSAEMHVAALLVEPQGTVTEEKP